MFGTRNPTLLAVLRRDVGSALVGFGNSHCFPGSLGILQDVNVADDIDELAVYDQITPRPTCRPGGRKPGRPRHAVRDLLSGPEDGYHRPPLRRELRLGAPRCPGPRGAVFDGYFGHSELFRIPGAAAATFVPVLSTANLPGPECTWFSGPGHPLQSRVVETRHAWDSPRPAQTAAHGCTRLARHH